MEKIIFVLYNPETKCYLGLDGPEFTEYDNVFGWSDYDSGGVLTYNTIREARKAARDDILVESGSYKVRKVTYKIEDV